MSDGRVVYLMPEGTTQTPEPAAVIYPAGRLSRMGVDELTSKTVKCELRHLNF
jgi:hypothetical protein